MCRVYPGIFLESMDFLKVFMYWLGYTYGMSKPVDTNKVFKWIMLSTLGALMLLPWSSVFIHELGHAFGGFLSFGGANIMVSMEGTYQDTWGTVNAGSSLFGPFGEVLADAGAYAMPWVFAYWFLRAFRLSAILPALACVASALSSLYKTFWLNWSPSDWEWGVPQTFLAGAFLIVFYAVATELFLKYLKPKIVKAVKDAWNQSRVEARHTQTRPVHRPASASRSSVATTRPLMQPSQSHRVPTPLPPRSQRQGNAV